MVNFLNILAKLLKTGQAVLKNPREINNVPRWSFSIFYRLITKFPTLKNKQPWITYRSTAWLEKNIHKKSLVFEYGSGGSTLYLSKRAKKVVSIENDEFWGKLMKKEIAKNKIKNVILKIIDTEKLGFSKYCSEIKKYPPNYFDLVIVDGRHRIDCIKKSSSKVKPGGYLLLDDSQRWKYRSANKILTKWKKESFQGLAPFKLEFSETSVWKKNEKK